MDLDGTINDNWNLLPDLKRKMIALSRQGVEFAIITGRDLLGTLYFVRRSQFPFALLGTGGGFIIFAPLTLSTIDDVISHATVEDTIKHGGLGKIDRLKKLQQICGCRDYETLYVEDNENGTADINEVCIKLSSDMNIATPKTTNERWVQIVRNSKGFVSDKPCGLGTLEILEHYFK
jgi:hypothetical protein